MSKIYLSGPISSLPLEAARRAFKQAEATLQAQGWEVVNPLDNGLPVDAPWEQHLAEDVLQMLTCKAVYMLRGWENSQGARLEYALAQRVKMRVIFETQMTEKE